MAYNAQFFNIRVPISFERLKLETSNLVRASTTRSSFDRMQRLGQRVRGPILGNLDFKFTDPCEYLSNG